MWWHYSVVYCLLSIMGSKVTGEKTRKFYVSLVIKWSNWKPKHWAWLKKSTALTCSPGNKEFSWLLSSNLFIKNRLLQDDRYEQNVMLCTFCIAVKLCSFFFQQDPTVFYPVSRRPLYIFVFNFISPVLNLWFPWRGCEWKKKNITRHVQFKYSWNAYKSHTKI